MGAAVSSNYAEQASSASTSFSTEIKQENKAAQSAQNEASQVCENMKIQVDATGATVSACNNKVSQGITAKQLQKTIQDASIQNESYQALQQKMSQAAKSVVKGFNFGAYSQAKNTVKQSMTASAQISNDISQECGASNAAVNKAFQKCDKVDIVVGENAEGADVRACNMDVDQQIIMEQVSECQQKSDVANKATQKLTQSAKQVAVAKSIGLDPFMLLLPAIIGAVIVAIIIVRSTGKIAQNVLKPKNVCMFVGLGCIGCGVFLYILTMLQDKEFKKPQTNRPQMLATAYPGDGQFIKANQLTEAQLDNFPDYCSSATTKSQCAAKPKGICEWLVRERECRIKTGLVGYPYKFRESDDPDAPGVTAVEVNQACEDDVDCSGWRWDALPSEVNAGAISMQQEMKPHTANAGTEVMSFLSGGKSDEEGGVFDREKCFNKGAPKMPLCQTGCPENTFPDIQDYCGIKQILDPTTGIPTGEKTFVTTKEECEGPSHNFPKSTSQGKDLGCTIMGCRWNKDINKCVNKGSGAKSWKCKTYNCVKCKEGEPLGTAVMYTGQYPGLPEIEEAQWSEDAYKRYATGLQGTSVEAKPTELSGLTCARFTQFGAVKLPPAGITKEGNKLRGYGGYGLMGLGLILVIIFAIMSIASKGGNTVVAAPVAKGT